eukprot:gene13321-16914_t
MGTLARGYAILLPLWFCLGFAYSLTQTPSGRLLRRSAHAEDRPALFAAQFALSHACWLITYPAAGWLGATLGLPATFTVMAIFAGLALALAMRVWPAGDPDEIEHEHPALAPDHPHLAGAGHRHRHAFVIDRDHQAWPTRGQTLFAAGDATRGFFGVREGRVRLVRFSADGRETALFTAGPGERFAEASLFAERYHCDAVAVSDAVVACYPKTACLERLSDDAPTRLDLT